MQLSLYCIKVVIMPHNSSTIFVSTSSNNFSLIYATGVVIGFEKPIVEVPENTPNGVILLCAKVSNGTLSRESIIDVVFQDVTANGKCTN